MKSLIITLLCASATALAATPNQAVLSWTAPTTYTDGTPVTDPITYTVYQGLQGETKVKVGSTAAVTYSVGTGLLTGKTYCWAVTAAVTADPTKESTPSAEACKSFPFATPAAPAGLTVK